MKDISYLKPFNRVFGIGMGSDKIIADMNYFYGKSDKKNENHYKDKIPKLRKGYFN